MSEQNIFSKLEKEKDIIDLKRRLKALQRELYSASESLDQYISEILKEDQKESLINYLSERKIDTNNPVKVEKGIQEIIELLEKIPVIDLIVAVIPSRNLLSDMLSEIEVSLGRRAVFRVYISEELVGGAVFAHGGVEFRDTLYDRIKS